MIPTIHFNDIWHRYDAETLYTAPALCEVNRSVTGDSCCKRQLMRSIDGAFVVRLNKLSKWAVGDLSCHLAYVTQLQWWLVILIKYVFLPRCTLHFRLITDFSMTLLWCHMGTMASQTTNLMIVYSTVQAQIKKSKLGVTRLCEGNSPVTGESPSQMPSNAENVFIWWRHHGNNVLCDTGKKVIGWKLSWVKRATQQIEIKIQWGHTHVINFILYEQTNFT